MSMYFFKSSSTLTLPLPLVVSQLVFFSKRRSFSPTFYSMVEVSLFSSPSSNILLFGFSRSSKTTNHLGASRRAFQQCKTMNIRIKLHSHVSQLIIRISTEINRSSLFPKSTEKSHPSLNVLLTIFEMFYLSSPICRCSSIVQFMYIIPITLIFLATHIDWVIRVKHPYSHLNLASKMMQGLTLISWARQILQEGGNSQIEEDFQAGDRFTRSGSQCGRKCKKKKSRQKAMRIMICWLLYARRVMKELLAQFLFVHFVSSTQDAC